MLILGIFIGAPLGMVLAAILTSAKNADLYRENALLHAELEARHG